MLSQIETVLNSRLLYSMSNDPQLSSVLTTGHFRILPSLSSLPVPAVNHIPQNRLSHWQLLQKMHEDFWNRWDNEYLHAVQQLYKCNIHS